MEIAEILFKNIAKTSWVWRENDSAHPPTAPPTANPMSGISSCYWPDFDQTLKVVLDQQQQQKHEQQHQQYLRNNWPDFDQTLKQGLWDQNW